MPVHHEIIYNYMCIYVYINYNIYLSRLDLMSGLLRFAVNDNNTINSRRRTFSVLPLRL